MNRFVVKGVWTLGLLGMGGAVLAADAAPRKAAPQEPAGFIAGGVIGGIAAGPFGAVIGAGLGTWLGNRVHRAGEANRMEAEVTALKTENAALLGDKSDLAQTNRALAQQLDQLSHSVQAAQAVQEAKSDAAAVLDGLQGDVLFRTGSAEISDDLRHGIQVLAQAVAKSPKLKVRVDGYADPRGTVDDNLKLSEARADAVRDLFLAAGVAEQSLEINAYGQSKSVAEDDDGYALERRVRLTLQAEGAAAVARNGAVH